jgi:hypothetical protein
VSYVQTYTSERAEQERRQAQAKADRFKALEQAQAVIMVQLQVIDRSGKSKATLDRLKEAEAVYAEAYSAILDAAPEAQAAISRRTR